MEEYGDIILVKNIVFNNGLADHASLQGRICMIVSDANDTLTLLPFTHTKPNTIDKNIYRLSKDDLLGKDPSINYYDDEYLNVTSLFQREIYYYDRMAHITERKYYYLLKRILEANLENNNYCSDIYIDIKEDLLEQKNYLKKKLKLR